MAGPRILVSFEHRLCDSTSRFGCQRMVHIGDTPLDAYYAGQAGFEFYDVTDPSWPSLI
jgi:hypothetical protein